MRTLTEVVQTLEQWETEHQPYDRVTRLPIHQFVQEGQGGALVPMAEASTLPEMHLQDHALGLSLGAELNRPQAINKGGRNDKSHLI